MKSFYIVCLVFLVLVSFVKTESKENSEKTEEDSEKKKEISLKEVRLTVTDLCNIGMFKVIHT